MDGKTDGRTEIRTPISHLAKVGATKMKIDELHEGKSHIISDSTYMCKDAYSGQNVRMCRLNMISHDTN